MNVSYQLIAIGIVFLITYIFFRGFGPRTHTLLYTRDEKTSWDASLSSRIGSWLVATSIFGTLTSFATWNFLTSSAKVFGWFALGTALTIMISPIVTNKLTIPIRRTPRIRNLLERNDQVTGVIASLFWGESRDKRALAGALKYVSLFSILSVIWLEFTAFVDVTASLGGIGVDTVEGMVARGAIMALAVFGVIYFVLRYGIRGFVFADLLHAPLIGVVVVTVVAVLGYTNWPLIQSIGISALLTPLLNTSIAVPFTEWRLGYIEGLVFLLHVLVLNTLQIVCSEPHWFRVWLLGDKEITKQRLGSILTGLGWLLILPIGFIAFALTNSVGDDAIRGVLTSLSAVAGPLILVFWIGATAALFSTADIQAYSALLVERFDLRRGIIRDLDVGPTRALWTSLSIAVLFAIVYVGARYIALPIDKLLVVIVPSALVLSPAFIHYWLGREPRAWVIALSALGYGVVAGWGFTLPQQNLLVNLSAIFVPPAVALFTIYAVPRLKTPASEGPR